MLINRIVRSLLATDMRRSSLIGPVNLIISALCYLILYPIILANSGIEVLGLWTILAAITQYIALSDVGFSVFLARKTAQTYGELEGVDDIRQEYATAARFYYGASVLGVVVALVVTTLWSYVPPGDYSRTSVAWSVGIVVLGAFSQLISQLGSAVLSGIGCASLVLAYSSPLPLIRLGLGVLGAVNGKPIEGLACGNFVEGILRWSLMEMLIRKKIRNWGAPTKFEWRDFSIRLRRLVLGGKDLYAITVASLLREPMFRTIIAATLGLGAAGTYDIARRIPEMLRALITGGLSTYLPALSKIFEKRDQCEVIFTVRKMTALLCLGGATAFGAYVVFSKSLIEVWIPNAPEDVAQCTRLFSIWCMVTLINVPYWYLLQAAHREEIAAKSLWLHTALLIFLVPLSTVCEISLQGYVLYWLLSSILTQIAIYVAIKRMFGFLWRALFPSLICITTSVVVCAGFIYVGFGNGTSMGIIELLYKISVLCVLVIAPSLYLYQKFGVFQNANGKVKKSGWKFDNEKF